MLTLWVIILLLAVVGWLIYLFNTLVSLSNHADASWAEIDAQLKRRYDLVDKLIALVSPNGVATEHLATARASAAAAFTPAEKSRTEPALAAATQSVLSATNPQWKDNEEFAQLEHTLHDIEDYLLGARREYNAIVEDLNGQAETFPTNYAASLFGIQSREQFQTDGDQPLATAQT